VKLFLVAFLCVMASTADARPAHFRGQFVETYIAAQGFLESLPAGARLDCEEKLCSFAKAVRIYVFENNGRRESFWSTDYCDVMFDEQEKMAACGSTPHLVYYDETRQLLFKESGCDKRSQKATPSATAIAASRLSRAVRGGLE
jgi:hypothetical protein